MDHNQANDSNEKKISIDSSLSSLQYNRKKPTDNGQGFRYLSDQTTWREVARVENGILLIQGWSEIYDEDAESNECLGCRSCLAEFPIPPDLQTDFC